MTGTVIGYARVSTDAQDEALQLDALERAGVIRIFTDRGSGATMQRPQLVAALDYVRDGDVLTVWRLDRLGRSLRDLIDQVDALAKRGVGFRSLTESIDTTTAGGKMVFHIFGALAEFERDLIRERTRAGLDAARARGRVGGRPTVMSPERIDTARKMHDEGVPVARIAETLGVGRSTVHRALTADKRSA